MLLDSKIPLMCAIYFYNSIDTEGMYYVRTVRWSANSEKANVQTESDYLDLALTFRLFLLSLLTLFFLHLSLIVTSVG